MAFIRVSNARGPSPAKSMEVSIKHPFSCTKVSKSYLPTYAKYLEKENFVALKICEMKFGIVQDWLWVNTAKPRCRNYRSVTNLKMDLFSAFDLYLTS